MALLPGEGEEPEMSMMVNEKEVLRRTGKEVIHDFLSSKTLYDMMRQSGKLVFFDTNIPIQLAFYALLEHDMPAAPLWDSVSRRFVGLLSVTDFIDILRHYHRRGIPMDELSARNIGEVISDVDGRRMQHSDFLGTDVSTSIHQACTVLRARHHRFLPVIPPDGTRVLAIASYYEVLRYLVDNFREQRRLFDDSIADLGIGTFGEEVLTVRKTAVLSDVLDAMEARDVSAVPVVDESDRVVGLYSRSDITFLATATDADSVLSNLRVTLQQILEQKPTEDVPRDRLETCSVHASLQSIFERFAEVGFHRLVCVDDERRCLGIVSARDLILYFCGQ